jgi:hypothetical protein
VLSNPIIFSFLVPVVLCCSVAWGQPKDNSDRPVSFAKEVAPIIVAKCGSCHVSNSKGSYGIESYDALINSDSIIPQDPANSHFIEIIESGEMPKGKQKISNGELKTLKKWIAQGALFDGDSKKKPLIEPTANDARQGAARGQRGRSGSGGSRLRAVEKNPQAVGDAGVAWYVTWETGLAEAKRTNRPIFFMSAATQCSGISGVF